jgi:Uma2 family endonuclease
MSPSITQPPRTTIIYPDSDGQRMAENTLQFEWIVTIKEGLGAMFRHNADVFVAGDLLWYPAEGNPAIRTAPDAMVVIGRPKGYRGSYKQWEENGIAPQIVFEIVAPGNRPGDWVRKFHFYNDYGVEEYYIYDPEYGLLEGWRRGRDGLEEIPQIAGFVSPRLGIRLEPGEGPNNLKIIGPDGEPFATYLELVEQRDAERQRAHAEGQRAEAERQRAEAERQRAEAERQRAEAERQRAERLAAKLRDLGLEQE